MKYIFATIGITYLIFITYIFVSGYVKCESIDGTFVRTPLSFTCITK